MASLDIATVFVSQRDRGAPAVTNWDAFPVVGIKVWARAVDKFTIHNNGGYAIDGRWLDVSPGQDHRGLPIYKLSSSPAAHNAFVVVCVQLDIDRHALSSPLSGQSRSLKFVYVLETVLPNANTMLSEATLYMDAPVWGGVNAKEIKIMLRTRSKIVDVVHDELTADINGVRYADPHHNARATIDLGPKKKATWDKLNINFGKYVTEQSMPTFMNKVRNAAYFGAAIATAHASDLPNSRITVDYTKDATQKPQVNYATVPVVGGSIDINKFEAMDNNGIPMPSDGIAKWIESEDTVTGTDPAEKRLKLKGKDYIRVKRMKFSLPKGYLYYGRLNGLAIIENVDTGEVTTLFPLIDVLNELSEVGKISPPALKKWAMLFEHEKEMLELLASTGRIAAQSVQDRFIESLSDSE